MSEAEMNQVLHKEVSVLQKELRNAREEAIGLRANVELLKDLLREARAL